MEIFLDIEGIPDQNMYYLMGLLICDGANRVYYALWADTLADEERMWHQFLTMIQERPHAPIYHYGSYELQAITKLGHRYQTDVTSLAKRLVNINAYIYGKIYFPLTSNRLKEIGHFLGASWTASNASGLQSLVWRYHWEKTGDLVYQQQLETYNEEDCQALKLLTDVLSIIHDREDAVADIDYYIHSKKSRTSQSVNPLHDELETILKFAHSRYDKHKVSFRKAQQHDNTQDVEEHKRAPYTHRKKSRKPTRTMQIPQVTQCPTCGCTTLSPSNKTTARMLIDLSFTKNGARKSITDIEQVLREKKPFILRCMLDGIKKLQGRIVKWNRCALSVSITWA